jgi:RecA-family ATPase
MNTQQVCNIDPSTLPADLYDKFVGDERFHFTPDGLDFAKSQKNFIKASDTTTPVVKWYGPAEARWSSTTTHQKRCSNPSDLIHPNKNVAPVWEYSDEVYHWDTLTGGGLYNAVGYAPIQLVAERVTNIMLTNKSVVVIGEDDDDDIEELLGDGWFRFNSEIGEDLSDQEYAMELRDEIATQPIGAVVLINQDGRLQHLDLITSVPVFRGTRVVTTKRIPIFHIHTEQWIEDGGRMQLKKEVFEQVVNAVADTKTVDDRVGCTQKAANITKEHREWLWPGYLGRNKVAHFGGASTEGKSPVTLDLVARVSAGLPWPDGAANKLGPKSVIILASEDDWSDTIIPRLELAGANLDNIYRFFVNQQTVEITPSLDSDCQRLEKQITEIGDVALIVIDPITNYLGSKKMNMEEEIRGGILMPLSLVAKTHDVAIVTVGHLNKRGNEAGVLQRLMGCAAFVGVARDVFIFGPDPEEDDDKYAHTMSEMRNKSAPQLKYRTESVPVEWGGKTSEVIRVKWCGVSHADVDEVVNAPKQAEKSVTTKAVTLIKGMLHSGAKRKAEIDQALKENGINPEELKFDRIRKRCKAETRALPGKSAGWEWFLTTKQEEIFDGVTRQ